jgi:hypothetical protein
MSAHNDTFPWMSYYGNYRFFESRIQSHNRVTGIINIGNGLYEVMLVDGRKLKTFICECYSYGIAEYFESVEKLGHLDAVIINSNWCGYSMQAKLHCTKQNVGLFNVGSFMAALNIKNYWEYLTKDEEEYLKNRGEH